MALDIIETKLFQETKEIIKKSISKYRFNLTFKSQAFNFINLPKILRSKEVCDNPPSNFDISDISILFLISTPVLDRTFLTIKNQCFI